MLLSLVLFGFDQSQGFAAPLAELQPFLKQHCFDCHSEGTTEGGLNLEALARSLDDPALFAKWERIFDRVENGEMPPKSTSPPPVKDRDTFLKSLGKDLTEAHAAEKGTVLRRLNRREYENTLNDLFGTDLKLVDRLPADGRAHEFDNVGAALSISLVQMKQYLECAKLVLDEAIQSALQPPEVQTTKASYADTRGAEQWLNKVWLHRDDGAVVFFKDLGYPSGMLREANVRESGWYRVRIRGYAFQSDKPITFGVGGTTFARGLEMPTFGYFSFPPGEPTTIEFKAWIPERYMIDITPLGISDKDNEIRKNGVVGYQGSGLAIQYVELEGPLVDKFPTRGHHLIFDGLTRTEIEPRNPADRKKSWYVPKFEIAGEPDIEPVLVRVASRLFRRPVVAAELATYLELYNRERELGTSTEDALRTAVTALMCSPDFLFLREPAGRLDDFALATRLSYFLTRSAPDDQLMAAAENGRLTGDRQQLSAQVQRLLADPRSERFITDFTDAWLNLRDIEFTNPDGQLFPEFDRFLQHSMVDETRAFFRTLVDENLGARNVVKADFAMLNNRLAEHYGIQGVAGPEIRKVTLPADSVRGGLLSQASVLKVSANGTNTSPVVRGVWVMERILGEAPPPPPAGVPGVEPDIRGASTLRELLDKHRNLDTCRACHELIDPPGFALESFNPIGGWRDRFRSLGDGDKVATEVHGQRVRYKLGPAVDASGSLPDGFKFAGFSEFRDQLAQDDERIATALVGKLLTFATGREMGFSDRTEISRIVRNTKSSNYGVRDLIQQIVASDIFLNK